MNRVKWGAVAGLVLHVLIAGMMIMAGLMKWLGQMPPEAVEELKTTGLGDKLLLIGAGELVSAILLLIPRTLSLGVLLTSLAHGWAHMENPPAFAARLQRWGLVISPETHALHHAAPHKTHYCITTGWLNPLLDKTRFFRRMETLSRKPTFRKLATSELPPWLTNGSGMPVTGSTPMHMPIFSMKWKPSMDVMQITMNDP